MKIKPLSPADQHNDALIARAARFDIAVFLGVGRYANDTAATLAEAATKAKALAAAVNNGRPALIYAMTADDRQALVTARNLREAGLA